LLKSSIFIAFFLPQQVRCELLQMHERLAQVLLKPTSIKQPPIKQSPGQRVNGSTMATVAAPQQSVSHRYDANNVVRVKIKPKKLSNYRPVLVADPGATLSLSGFLSRWCGAADAGDEKITLLVRIPDVAQGWVTILPLAHLLAYYKQTSQEPPPTPPFYRGRFGPAGRELQPLPERIAVEEGGLAWLTLSRGSVGSAGLYAPGGTLMAVCRPDLRPPALLRPSGAAEAEAGASHVVLPAEKVDAQV
jgi:hypothetical protein